MKIALISIASLLCGVLLGFVLNTILLVGGFNWFDLSRSDLSGPDLQSTPAGSQAQSPPADSEPSAVPPNANSTPVEKLELAKLVKSERQSNVGGHEAAVSLQFDSLRAFQPQSSIADQLHVLDLIANANLDQINGAIAGVPDDDNRIHQSRWVIGLLIQRKIELDPDGTLQEVAQLVTAEEGIRYNNMTQYLLIENYARMQPELMIEWMGSLPDDSIHPEQLMTIYTALAQSDPETAMQMVMQNSALASSRYGGIDSILYTWSEQDPQAALQWLEQNGDKQLLLQHAESIVYQMVDRDPEAARAAQANFPGMVSENMFLFREIQTLATSDPLAALQMAESMSNKDEAASAMHSVFYEWSTQDPIAAFEYIESIPQSAEREMYAQSIAESIGSLATRSAEKREELLGWSESLSPELRLVVREPILNQWMEFEPEAALAWLNTQSDVAEKSRLVRSIAWVLPEHDLQQSMDLFVSADSETQMTLSQGIINKLYEEDPDSAWQWYQELPENEVKQSSLFGLVLMTASENPQKALDLAGSMDDTGQLGMFTSVLQAVAFEYPEEAEDWLTSADIDEQQKTELRAQIAQIRGAMGGYPEPPVQLEMLRR